MIFSKHLSPTRSVVARNTISQLIGKIFTAGTTFLISLLVAQKFGADTFGDFTKVTTYVAFFYLLADFGMNAVYLQQSASSNQQSDEDNLRAASRTLKARQWSILFGARIVGSTFLILLSVILLSFLPYGTSQGYTPLVRLAIQLFSLSIFLQAVLTTANALFQKHFRYDLSTVAVGTGSVVSLILIWLGSRQVNSGIPPFVFVTEVMLVGSFVTAVMALLYAGKLQKSVLPSFSFEPMKQLFLQSVPLGATLIFNLIYFRVDSLIMTLSRSTLEVGIYGFAYKIFEVPLVFPTFFMNAVYPLFLKHTNGTNSGELKRIVKKSFVFLLLSSLILLALFWITAPLLSLVRPEFAASVIALRILILGLPFFFLSSLTMWTLIALKKQTLLAFIYGISMVVNIVLNSLYIPVSGFVAASWITVGSEALVFFVSGILVLKYLL